MLRIVLLSVLIISGCTSEKPVRSYASQESQTVETQTETEGSTSSETELRSQIYTGESNIGIWDYIFYSIVIIYLVSIHVVTILLFKKYNDKNDLADQLYRRLSYFEDKLKKEKIRFEDLKKRYSIIEEEKQRLNKIIDFLEEKKTESVTKKKPFRKKSSDEVRKHAAKKEEKFLNSIFEGPNQKINYFSMPNENGTFALKRGDESSEGRKYYKVRFREGGDIGKVNYISGPLDKSAIDQMDSILKPVCYIMNSEITNPTSIECKEEGTVKLIGDEWVIKEKIKLEFKR